MKSLVLASGGIDSSTCVALAIEEYGKENVIALSFLYGQKHSKELEAAKAVSDYYRIEQITVDISGIFRHSECSLLTHTAKDIPKGSYSEQLQQGTLSTYVPFRNGLFLSAAASIAISKNCGVIYYGAHMDDAAGNAYPDCSEVFNNAMGTSIFEGSGQRLRLISPFISLSKADIIKKGLELNVPYELTWSCYEGGDSPCGTCGTCIDRKNAFLHNGIEE